jgi:hypothetical protein
MATNYYGEWLKTYACYSICDFTLKHQDMSQMKDQIQRRISLEDKRYLLETDIRYHPLYQTCAPLAIMYYHLRSDVCNPVSKWLFMFRLYAEAGYLLSTQDEGYDTIDRPSLQSEYNKIFAQLSTYDSNAPATHIFTTAFICVLQEYKIELVSKKTKTKTKRKK